MRGLLLRRKTNLLAHIQTFDRGLAHQETLCRNHLTVQ